MKKALIVFLMCIQFVFFAEEPKNNKYKILLGSPIHQKPSILKEFLESLKRLEKKSFTLDYFFFDDNNSEESKMLLNDFKNSFETNCLIITTNNNFKYHRDAHQHYWSQQLIWKVAEFKDKMIKKAAKENYDYLFLIDSDIVLHPKTIEQLISTKKDIVSNIFWTIWSKNGRLLPQVWLKDFYTLYAFENGETLSAYEKNKRTGIFLNMLKRPGTYAVGGLGACTLISKTALTKGVCFKKISNLTLNGEDRHFCVRALSLGLSLFVDTHYPAYHIYKDADLQGVENFKKNCEIKIPRLTLSMVVKNEANRYLRKVLEHAKEYITDAVIIDDGSTDNSAEICLEVLKGIPLKIITNSVSKFSNEVELRKQQWEETVKTNPEWIIALDADEIFEDKFKHRVKELISSNDVDAYFFRLYDFWDENHYRDEKYWRACHYYSPFLIRYDPKISYHYSEQPQHCGRFPKTIINLKKCYSDLRLKHFGWAKYEDRVTKYLRYKKLDPDAKYGCKGQYDSILNFNPTLVEWKE